MAARGNLVPLLKSSGYQVKELLGSGSFGHVYLCRRPDTGEMVAVKAVAKAKAKYGKEEVNNLELLRKLDADKNSLIRFNRHLERQGNVFLEFEKLDMTLYDFVFNNCRQLFLSEIQPITRQLLVALNALKSISMVHCDIKLNNIMLVNHCLQPCKVKLIDFGTAELVSNMELGDVFQHLSYRAPEVSLGLPLSEAVDMWSLGSVITTSYLKAKLYSGHCELANINDIVQLLGQPDDHVLKTGAHTRQYFYKDQDSLWKLKRECSCSMGKSCHWRSFHPLVTNETTEMFASLDDIIKTRPGSAAYEDTQAFISLLKEMMQVDPKKRITPSEALTHPFITLTYFPSDCAASNNERTPLSASLIHNSTAKIDDRPPQRASSDNTNVSKTSPASVSLLSNGDKISTGNGTIRSKAKDKIKLFKTFNGFISRLFKKRSSRSLLDEESVATSDEEPPPHAASLSDNDDKPPQKASSGVVDASPASDSLSSQSSRGSQSSPSSQSSKTSEQRAIHPLITHETTEMFTSLDDIVQTRPGSAAYEDTQAFIGLLKEMMQVDPKKRITPGEALTHPFITRKYFPSDCAASITERTPPSVNLVHSAFNNNNRPPQTNGTKVSETSTGSSRRVSDKDEISTVTGTKGFNVKAKNKLFKRFHGFLSRLFKKKSSRSLLTEEETAASSDNKPPPTASLTDSTDSDGGPPHKASSGDANAAETSPASSIHVSDLDDVSIDDETMGSKVKAKNKLFKTFHGLFHDKIIQKYVG
ncbi:homeodomain-interacting protein kinase 2-like [Solea senegalensis]|uniref:Homeodomain-interacting protein kinase 2-like n=2 Tax=Solea senegalensis TaxID=28829 RepID=A0AAV6PDL7_SOLSE|nr:homeodomain-interacting protein kinase 2-like [Solea senegalensis]